MIILFSHVSVLSNLSSTNMDYMGNGKKTFICKGKTNFSIFAMMVKWEQPLSPRWDSPPLGRGRFRLCDFHSVVWILPPGWQLMPEHGNALQSTRPRTGRVSGCLQETEQESIVIQVGTCLSKRSEPPRGELAGPAAAGKLGTAPSTPVRSFQKRLCFYLDLKWSHHLRKPFSSSPVLQMFFMSWNTLCADSPDKIPL